MGRILNPSQIKSYEAVNSEIYVDKTQLLYYTNSIVKHWRDGKETYC